MFARVKKIRGHNHLQIVESYRVPSSGKIKQRMILDVGRYCSLYEALLRMPRDLNNARRRAAKLRKEYEILCVSDLPRYTLHRGVRQARAARKEARELEHRLDKLLELVNANQELETQGGPLDKVLERKDAVPRGGMSRHCSDTAALHFKAHSSYSKTLQPEMALTICALAVEHYI